MLDLGMFSRYNLANYRPLYIRNFYCNFVLIISGTSLLQVQNLLDHCSQHLDKDKMHQGPAVLGIAMVAMAEELGVDMAIRSLEQLLQYGEQNVRRAVPLALGLLCISNPKVK
jgi:26S proteasome regulatory subunit N1